MTAQSARFARTLIARFDALGYDSDREIEAAGGPSSTWMTQLRKAAHDVGFNLKQPRSDTAKRIEHAARWEPKTVRRVWAGGEPELADSVANPDLVRKIDEAEGFTAAEKRRLKALLSQDQPEVARRAGKTG